MLGILLIAITMHSCQKNEKDNLIAVYDEMYSHVLNLEFDKIEPYLNEESKVFFNDITDGEKLNVDSILVLGKKYGLPYMLIDYLAITGDKIKDGAPSTDLYNYLGLQKVSLFSYEDAYYVDKAKSKVGEENFVSIIKDDLTTSKRGWTRFSKNEAGEYKYDLIYTLRLKENANKRQKYAERKRNPDKKTLDDYLSFYYWQNSGEANVEFQVQQEKIKASMLEARSDMIEIINERKN